MCYSLEVSGGSWILSQWMLIWVNLLHKLGFGPTAIARESTHFPLHWGVEMYAFTEICMIFSLFSIFIHIQYFLWTKEKDCEEGFAQIGACLVPLSVSNLWNKSYERSSCSVGYHPFQILDFQFCLLLTIRLSVGEANIPLHPA